MPVMLPDLFEAFDGERSFVQSMKPVPRTWTTRERDESRIGRITKGPSYTSTVDRGSSFEKDTPTEITSRNVSIVYLTRFVKAMTEGYLTPQERADLNKQRAVLP